MLRPSRGEPRGAAAGRLARAAACAGALLLACASRQEGPSSPSGEAPASHVVGDAGQDGGPGSAARTERPSPEPDRDAQALFQSAERALLAAPGLRLEAHLTAEGAVTADLRGTWWLPDDGRVRVDVAGLFMERPVELRLVSDGRELLAGPVATPRRQPAGPAVREALVLGLTRMGLLHNVAVLDLSRPPDGSDGGAGDWARIAHAEVLGPSGHGGPRLRLLLQVGGRDVGEATLELDARGLPRERRQTVHFPRGDMHVVERYEALETAATVPPALFEVDG